LEPFFLRFPSAPANIITKAGEPCAGVIPIAFSSKRIGMAAADTVVRKFLKNQASPVFKNLERLAFKLV
jgi:antitoxin (DNA-binding transcriptional repressor) of toxin-antitoxin stability system